MRSEVSLLLHSNQGLEWLKLAAIEPLPNAPWVKSDFQIFFGYSVWGEARSREDEMIQHELHLFDLSLLASRISDLCGWLSSDRSKPFWLSDGVPGLVFESQELTQISSPWEFSVRCVAKCSTDVDFSLGLNMSASSVDNFVEQVGFAVRS